MWRTLPPTPTTTTALASSTTPPLLLRPPRQQPLACSSATPCACAASRGRADSRSCRVLRRGGDDDATAAAAAAAPRARARAAAAALAATLLLAPPSLANDRIVDADPVFDGANVLRPEARAQLSRALRDLDAATGLHLRVFTQFRLDAGGPDAPTPRALWGSLDNETAVLVVDPSSPNVINAVHIGDTVLRKLRRPFWVELQSRYGNLFFVRDNGAAAALLAAAGAITDCLQRADGCRVVPGLPAEQYWATLWCSVAGGVALGFAARIQDDLKGVVRRRWVWPLLFSPLWGSLFVSFGLGPVVSRTDDVAPVAANALAFLAAAAAPTLLQRLWDGDDKGPAGGGPPPPLPPLEAPPPPPQPVEQQPPSSVEQQSPPGGGEGDSSSTSSVAEETSV